MSFRVTRAKERKEKALIIFHAAKEMCGDDFDVRLTDEDEHSREVWVRVAHKITGAAVTIELDGDSPFKAGEWVLSWYGVRAPHRFAPSFAGSVNPVHWHKATDTGVGFDAMVSVVLSRLAAIRSGEAFQAPENPAYSCRAPAAPGVPARIISAPSSWEARKRFAAGHAGMNAHDVIAVRKS